MNPKSHKIVEACPTVFVRPTGQEGWNYFNSMAKRILPCIDGDPSRDLNAMHEAKSTFNKDQQDAFINHLINIIIVPAEVEYGPLSLSFFDKLWIISNATAEQEAEALLRTFSKKT